jgi:hypothetical protein
MGPIYVQPTGTGIALNVEAAMRLWLSELVRQIREDPTVLDQFDNLHGADHQAVNARLRGDADAAVESAAADRMAEDIVTDLLRRMGGAEIHVAASEVPGLTEEMTRCSSYGMPPAVPTVTRVSARRAA